MLLSSLKVLKFKTALLVLAGGFIWPAGLQAQLGSDAAEELRDMKSQLPAREQQLLKAPAGVFDVEYDENGELVRLKIKGEAEVSTALSGLRADREARGKAERNAKAAFSKFLEENVTVSESDTETFVIREKSGQESAEFLSASAKTLITLSTSLQRGLTILLDHVEGEGVNRGVVVVLGWSKKLNLAALRAQAEMKKSPSTLPPDPAQEKQAVDSSKPGGQTQTRIGDVENF